MSEDDEVFEPPEWWRSTLTAAWFETRMEADRTMVALAAGGIALLVTLLTTVGAEGVVPAALYAIALAGFIAAITFGLIIFKKNADHIAEAATDPDKADMSPLRPTLRRLDTALISSFAVGVAFSIAVGITEAIARDAGEPEPRETLDARQPEAPRDPPVPDSIGTEERGRGDEPPAETSRVN